jgi:hypothetical protein
VLRVKHSKFSGYVGHLFKSFSSYVIEIHLCSRNVSAGCVAILCIWEGPDSYLTLETGCIDSRFVVAFNLFGPIAGQCLKLGHVLRESK